MASSSLARIRAIVVLFPLPQKVHGVFFREHASVAVLAGDSKLSFWVAWTVMKVVVLSSTALSSRRFFSGFFAAPEAYKRGRLSDGYITMKLNKTPFNCSRHN